jgi:hypothetical protein
METSTNPPAWLVPGARLRLFSLTEKGAIHYAQLGAERVLCGINHNGYASRGLVEASNVFIQKLVGSSRTRRLSAKWDCLKCMEIYAAALRPNHIQNAA